MLWNIFYPVVINRKPIRLPKWLVSCITCYELVSLFPFRVLTFRLTVSCMVLPTVIRRNETCKKEERVRYNGYSMEFYAFLCIFWTKHADWTNKSFRPWTLTVRGRTMKKKKTGNKHKKGKTEEKNKEDYKKSKGNGVHKEYSDKKGNKNDDGTVSNKQWFITRRPYSDFRHGCQLIRDSVWFSSAILVKWCHNISIIKFKIYIQ